MSAPKNIQRDGQFVTVDRSLNIPLSSPAPWTTSSNNFNSDGVVHVDYGSAANVYPTTISMAAGDVATIGVYISPPIGDRHPYRVKASTSIPVDGDAYGMLMFAWAPSSITGTDDSVSNIIWRPFINDVDDLFIIEQPPSGLENRALAIGVSIVATKSITSLSIASLISVQNLGVKPPTMQNAVA